MYFLDKHIIGLNLIHNLLHNYKKHHHHHYMQIKYTHNFNNFMWLD